MPAFPLHVPALNLVHGFIFDNPALPGFEGGSVRARLPELASGAASPRTEGMWLLELLQTLASPDKKLETDLAPTEIKSACFSKFLYHQLSTSGVCKRLKQWFQG